MNKKQQHTFYDSLLLFLWEKYSLSPDSETDLNDFIRQSKIGAIEAKKVLIKIENDGYITWFVYKMTKEGYLIPTEWYKTIFASGEETLENNTIKGALTPTGIEYAVDLEIKTDYSEKEIDEYIINQILTFAKKSVPLSLQI